jgi:O-phosphoseryl-tRNA(Cys) synthetase
MSNQFAHVDNPHMGLLKNIINKTVETVMQLRIDVKKEQTDKFQ